LPPSLAPEPCSDPDPLALPLLTASNRWRWKTIGDFSKFVRRDNPKNPYKYACSGSCGASFKTYDALRFHRTAISSGVPWWAGFSCTVRAKGRPLSRLTTVQEYPLTIGLMDIGLKNRSSQHDICRVFTALDTQLVADRKNVRVLNLNGLDNLDSSCVDALCCAINAFPVRRASCAVLRLKVITILLLIKYFALRASAYGP
jgi:hypothetical protein